MFATYSIIATAYLSCGLFSLEQMGQMSSQIGDTYEQCCPYHIVASYFKLPRITCNYWSSSQTLRYIAKFTGQDTTKRTICKSASRKTPWSSSRPSKASTRLSNMFTRSWSIKLWIRKLFDLVVNVANWTITAFIRAFYVNKARQKLNVCTELKAGKTTTRCEVACK